MFAGRAWLRASLNEHTLERYLQDLLADTSMLKLKHILKQLRKICLFCCFCISSVIITSHMHSCWILKDQVCCPKWQQVQLQTVRHIVTFFFLCGCKVSSVEV